MHSRDLYHGTSGVTLALAESLGVEASVRPVVEEALRGLREPPAKEDSAAAASLYMGEAGVAVALLRAGQVLEDPALIASALERADFVAAQPHHSPDMIVGAAGRLRSHLLLWDETREPRQLQAAVAAGEWLLGAAESVGPEARRWVIPPGFDDLSGHSYPGYAHGAAGVGDVLLELHEATGDERFREAARGALAWVTGLAVPVLEEGSGRAWPMREGGPLFALWCYGAPGIGTFLLNAAGRELSPGVRALAEGAARATSRVGRWAAPTQCHGLAGSIELLLDMYQGTGERAWLTEAWSLARLLETFLVESEQGPGFSSDVPELVTPDYMVGTAGVLSCLLRLGDPENRPRQLSRRGFRFRPSPPSRG
jgi:lantibiotic modifying enzyme